MSQELWFVLIKANLKGGGCCAGVVLVTQCSLCRAACHKVPFSDSLHPGNGEGNRSCVPITPIIAVVFNPDNVWSPLKRWALAQW